MRTVFPGAVDVFYEESKAARAWLDELLISYRRSTTAVLTLATGAATFFGLGDTPKGPFFVGALVAYALAAGLAVSLYWPVAWVINVSAGAQDDFAADDGAELSTTKVKFDFATGHQRAIGLNSAKILSRAGIARRFTVLVVATGFVVLLAAVNVLVVVDAAAPSVTRVQIMQEG